MPSPYNSNDRRQYQTDAVNAFHEQQGGTESAAAPPPQQQQQQNPPPNPFNYEQARDKWMSGQYGLNEDGVRQWANEFGINYNGGDSIELPNGGGWMDVIGNFKSGQNMRHTWTPAGGNGPNANGGGGGNATPPAGGIPGAGGAPNVPPGVSDELYKMLLDRAKQGTQINRNDPNIRQQVDPYAAAQERARRNYLADAAERGGPLVNLRGEQRVAMERAGQATGQFEGQLIGRELENRRNEIQHALDSLGNRLTEDQRLALQRELGYLSDATSRYGIDKSAESENKRIGLGYDELDWRRDPRNPANYF
jgi:hypothetical protein